MNALTLLAQTETTGLTGEGLAVMIVCIGMVLCLTGFCFYQILTESTPEDRHHAPLDIDTRDVEDEEDADR